MELFQKRKDRSFILVSHDPGIIRAYCERAAVLHLGKLYEFPSVDEAFQFYETQNVAPPGPRFD